MHGIKISNKEYRSRDGVSSTDLKHMAKSPAHFRYWKDNPQEDTPALLFGRASHKYMLEENEFFTEFAIAPNIDKRTKSGKEEYAKFLEINKGKDIITADDFQKIKDMREALYATPSVKLLLSGQKELSFFLEDEETGIMMKCRPDCITNIADANILIDYKSCQDASSEAFMRNAINLNYDLQMSYYKDIMDKATERDYSVIFIAQEKTPPYAVNILEADEYFIKSGRDMYRTYLDLYKDCLDTGKWHGYIDTQINSIGLPRWMQKYYEI